MAPSDPLRFGGFALNSTRGCLEDCTGTERFLRPKSYRVLEVLCARRGQLVSKDDLIQEVWADVIVSDDSLAQCVSEVRRALGPDGAGLLRTVPRRGYMLTAEEAAGASSANLLRKVGLPAAGGLAVTLSAAIMGVWWAWPGEVSQQPETPETIASPMQDAAALLQTRDWRRRGDNAQARRLLEKVVADDPDNADAWARLGLTYWLEVQHIAWGGGRREMGMALDMVTRAVTLGDSAGPHRLLAEMRLLAPFADMRSSVDALANARAAVTIEPGNPDNLAVLAQVLALAGRTDESVDVIEQALRMNTTPPDWHRQIAGLCHLLAGNPARATEELGPLHGAGTFVGARWWPGWLLAASLAHAGRIEEAEMIVHAANGRRPEQNTAAVAQSLDGIEDGPGLALILDGLRRAGMPG